MQYFIELIGNINKENFKFVDDFKEIWIKTEHRPLPFRKNGSIAKSPE